MTLKEKIISHLDERGLTYQYLEHAPTPTCELSAQARGIDQRFGGKTLLLKDKEGFKLFTLSAASEADSKKIRHILSSQKLRFASESELLELVGVSKGALPPFGQPLLDFPHYLDESIYQNELIAFNPGVLDASIIMKRADYLLLTPHSIRCDFARVL